MAFKMRKFSGFKEMETDNDQEKSIQDIKIENMRKVLENPEKYSRKRVNRNIQRFRKFKSMGIL